MTDSFLETIYREMYPKIYTFARLRLQDEQLAQELAQDVFVLAQEKLEELRQSPNPQGWLIRAAGYAVLHAQRERAAIARRTVPLEELQLSAPPPEAEDSDLREHMSQEEWMQELTSRCCFHKLNRRLWNEAEGKENTFLEKISGKTVASPFVMAKSQIVSLFQQIRTLH